MTRVPLASNREGCPLALYPGHRHSHEQALWVQLQERLALLVMPQALHHAKSRVDVVSETHVRTHFARPNCRASSSAETLACCSLSAAKAGGWGWRRTGGQGKRGRAAEREGGAGPEAAGRRWSTSEGPHGRQASRSRDWESRPRRIEEKSSV